MNWLLQFVFSGVITIGYIVSWFFFKLWIKDQKNAMKDLSDEMKVVRTKIDKVSEVINTIELNINNKYIKTLEKSIADNNEVLGRHDERLRNLEKRVFKNGEK